MAYADRDWNRARRPQRASSWTVNGTIIALCVAVFVIDGFLGRSMPATLTLARTDLTGAPLRGDAARAKPLGEPIPLAMAAQRAPEVVRIAAAAGVAQARVQVQLLGDGDKAVGFRFCLPTTPLKALLYFSTSSALLGQDGLGLPDGWPQLWRFIGFQFLHADVWHLAFNMLGLFFFGPVVERYLGGKRYAAFYLLCGICGAVMYLLLNLLGTQFGAWRPGAHVPFLLLNDPTTPLIGASAGVFGVVMAAAYLAPQAEVLLYFVLPMRLRTLAYTLVAVAMLTLFLGGGNAGGEAAHLGGAIAGYWLIRRPHLLHRLFDWMGTVDPTSRTRRVRANRARGVIETAEIDRILDKIRRQGLQSLNDGERRTLREASRRQA
jgi:membrane associated rhomboid family serine protease